ncbi:hypothetical protein KR054_002096 [Drosophila jambulina]|nr:hypothetical protein KR054_002096 [Drosophila jambulina]
MANAAANVRCINFYDLCRICTDSSDHKTNVYSSEGRAKNLSSKISECLSLQVRGAGFVPDQRKFTNTYHLQIDEKDRLPKVVCAQCVQLVEQMHSLRATCRNSQTMLSNCLNIRPTPTGDKLYIRDAVDESGKSLSVVQAAPSASGGAQQSSNLLNSIMQAVGMQPQQQYTITVDNGIQQQQQQNLPEVQVKSEKQTVLEEFIRLKPDIKITPLSKKEANSNTARTQPVISQPPPLQPQTVTTATVNTPQLQLQTQIGDQLQPLWQQIQQLQLQQQLQQLTNQLQATTQFTAAAAEDSSSPGDSKKPKLNFVLSGPTAPQFTTSLPQFGTNQPQIQLQLMPGGAGVTSANTASTQPQFNAAALLSSLATPQSSAQNMLSPSKCFLPVTIRDENSDQQIVAHIDTKNLMLPTTYQVQMKLQPQLATADGQPIMQLTPTSIPATLQLTPQTLSSSPGNSFQGTATSVSQNQFLAPQPPQQQQQQQQQLAPLTAQVTSQQIIRSPQTSTSSPQLVIRNVTTMPTTPTTPTNSKEAPAFKTPSPRQRQLPAPKPKTIQGSSPSSPATNQPAAGTNMPPINEVRRLVTPPKQQQQLPVVKPPQTSTSTSNPTALQRLSSNTTITKLTAKQSTPVPAQAATQAAAAPAKLPLLNKQNITISRISTATGAKQQMKPPVPAPGPQPIHVTVPALSQAPPPPLASQHKKPPDQVQETSAQKVKSARPPTQKIQPLSSQDGQNTSGDASTASGGSALICPTCNREFKKKEHLTQHVKLHAGLRPFKCSEDGCDKSFSRKEHLSRHLISHSGQKMYTCEVCRKPFSRKDNLNKHKRIHTQTANDTLYCCDVCNKNFATKLHFEKHREMHKKPRPENATPTAAPATPAATSASAQVRSNGQVSNKGLYEVKQRPLQQQQHQTQAQPQAQQAQIMHVVTTQDLAGNTITITQAPDSNMPASLANFVQLGFPQFQNASTPATNQLVCKLAK